MSLSAAIRWARRPGSWSYRAKVPLLIAGISVLTALAISAAIAISARTWLREDLRQHATAVAQSLARGLIVHIARDDVWEAFEAVRAVASADGGTQQCDVVVLDRKGLVFVSSDPIRFGIRMSTRALTPSLREASAMTAKPGDMALAETRDNADSFTVVNLPLLSADREVIGSLLMSYSHDIFKQRYRDTVATLASITLGLVVLLIPLGWWLGHRLANPVARVTDALYRMGEDAALRSSAFTVGPSASTAPGRVRVPTSELARLEHSLAQLQQQLDEKEQLQRQFVAADRLAAIGRMTAGVAHEINNPLAGMLNALSNLRKDPGLLQKTLALLERGLDQIRQTLSALLIETKTSTRPLSPEDIDDLHVLVHPQAQRKQLALGWHYPFHTELDVPAAPVRQVVLNLLLNAVQASDSRIDFSAGATAHDLVLRVSNDGQEFPVARRQTPFEPIVGGEGHGLGLWASHQLVLSMGGTISLAIEAGLTVFEVRLPLHPLPHPAVGSTAIHALQD